MPADDSRPADPNQTAVRLPDHVAGKAELSRIQFLKNVEKLLIRRLPDDARRAMTADDGLDLTPDSLERAATWRELNNISNEAADRLAEIAARFVGEKDRLQWIEEQLEEWGAQVLGDVRQETDPDLVGAQRSVVELVCLVLRERRGIGTDSSGKILEDKIREAIEKAKFSWSGGGGRRR